MTYIQLPISKSIYARTLILQFIHRQPLLRCYKTYPVDIQILHKSLKQLQSNNHCTLHLGNNGTAVRFLTSLCATLPGCCVVLTGSPRLRERPIAQLVDVINSLGGKIEYIEEKQHLPIRIYGKSINKNETIFFPDPLSTQFISSLLLVGFDVTTNIQSPYIDMTRSVISFFKNDRVISEKDWSGATFWYEYVALHGGIVHLKGLHRHSLQGDSIVAEIYNQLGVKTVYCADGVTIQKESRDIVKVLNVDFSQCPDLYPAVAITCWKMQITLIPTLPNSLHHKESDRIVNIERIISNKEGGCYSTSSDHRIAMALLCADILCDDTNCIQKSYPFFLRELNKIKNSSLTTKRG